MYITYHINVTDTKLSHQNRILSSVILYEHEIF